MGSFYIENFGCRATQADGAALERQFLDQGLQRASAKDAADVVVLNTCTVTSRADQDARSTIRRVHRANPKARIVVTGCYAQRAPREISELAGVSQVIGNSHKHELARIVVQPQGFVPIETLTASPVSQSSPPLTGNQGVETEIFVSDIFAHTELLAAPVFDAANERTRPNLKVQDGCDNRCSFCVIPSVRGQSRSLPLERVISEAAALVNAGYKELVISGINLGRWGRDLKVDAPSDDATTGAVFESTNQESLRKETRFVDLIRALLSRTSLEKLRISSVEPMDWSDELISLIAKSPRIAKHAHVPMQSGSDAVLRRMHRKYRPWHYREKILKIRDAMPTAAIGADVMVGFPGETDQEFEETRRLIRELPFTYLHVFTFSGRPGTPAAEMQNQVPVRIARDRNRILRELAAQKKLEFMQSFVGKSVEAITLKNAPDVAVRGTQITALTDNYLKLRLAGPYESNRWISAIVGSVEDGELVAS